MLRAAEPTTVPFDSIRNQGLCQPIRTGEKPFRSPFWETCDELVQAQGNTRHKNHARGLDSSGALTIWIQWCSSGVLIRKHPMLLRFLGNHLTPLPSSFLLHHTPTCGSSAISQPVFQSEILTRHGQHQIPPHSNLDQVLQTDARELSIS
ncbi:hypothetical protein N657DRAFT_100220 [Parathielavia appendiculata]|uniref:Uncharacterized protein n=1 Tax=Parathielavia appendiculata TaxID=2587402 RepID=A0AAN6TW70_9PEZI|nr:hypothetical protein N657DRAFT_100220 [Parathielavia appendiculata]